MQLLGFRQVFMCVWQQVLSDVAMEEVGCESSWCRRRTSLLTLTLPQSKLVRLKI